MSDAGPSCPILMIPAAAVAETTLSTSEALWSLVLLVLLTLINAFFAASEMAVISLNDTKLYAMAEDGNKKAKTIRKLVKEPSKFLSSIQIGITLAGLLSSAFAADRFAPPLAAWLHTFLPFVSLGLLSNLALVVLTILLSFFTLIFGELVPKRMAQHNPERLSFAFVGVLNFCFHAFKPFVFVLAKTTNGVLRLLGIDPNQEPENVTEEEIRMMVDVGNEKGVIEESQREMINNIFEFDDKTAAEIMTHRTEVSFVSMEDGLEEVLNIATTEGYSRIPVYQDDIDDVVGIIYVKDLLPLVMQKDTSNISLKNYLRPALFVPESNRCKELFHELTEKKLQMAIVVDEYGGTAGIVTMEDILESIVGNIQDEYDQEEEEITKTGDDTYLLEGSANLEEVFEHFGLDLPEDVDCETIGGYVIDLLGRIPQDGETPEVEDGEIHFQVLEAEDRRILKLTAKRIPHPENDEEEDDD